MSTLNKDGRIAAVQVAVRIRPLTEHESAQPRSQEVLCAQDKMVQVAPYNKFFTFDHVFSTQSRQSDIFSSTCEKLIYKFIDGYNVTMLAYGQTSSGKTYTMGTSQVSDVSQREDEGIIPRAVALMFYLLEQGAYRSGSPCSSVSSIDGPLHSRGHSRVSQPNGSTSKYKYSVGISFVEIYNEELIDLLNLAPPAERPPVTIREDTRGHIYWSGVKEVTVQNAPHVIRLLQQGTENRATSATDMNEKSSRSHAIFSVTLRQERWVPSETPISKSSPKPRSFNGMRGHSTTHSEDGEWVITTSKLHFVDLAGSERLKRTAAEGDRRKEGININAGLLALGNVISALGDPTKRSTHIPYRDSKLTRLLQDSLGGTATTLMIACVSPAEYNLSETLNTLQYANRARNIKNRTEKNEVEEWMTTNNVDQLRQMVAKLKSELHLSKSILPSVSPPLTNGSEHSSSPTSGGDFEHMYQEQCLANADLRRQIEELETKLTFTVERNRVVEKHLQRTNHPLPTDVDFQHLVEPVIEEYEKSISALESQLAMLRAALVHAESEIQDLHQKESYAVQLEGKLKQSAKEALRDQDLLQELRTRILKFKEMDENTEKYIADLEEKLTNARRQCAQHVEDRSVLEERVRQVEQDRDDALAQLSSPDMSNKDQRIHRLQEELIVLKLKLSASTEQNTQLMRMMNESSIEQLALRDQLNQDNDVIEPCTTVSDQDIEELMQRMNAMKLELESSEGTESDTTSISTPKTKKGLVAGIWDKSLGRKTTFEVPSSS